MNNNRPVAILLGIAAAMLVIMTGKACSDSLGPQKAPVRTSTAPATYVPHAVSHDEEYLNATPPAEYFTEAPAPPEIIYEDVTDEEGNVIGTIAVEPETEEVSKSLAEQYEEQKEENRKNRISGYYHDSKDAPAPEGSVQNATFPEDFILYIG
jgi:hypothetical protein